MPLESACQRRKRRARREGEGRGGSLEAKPTLHARGHTHRRLLKIESFVSSTRLGQEELHCAALLFIIVIIMLALPRITSCRALRHGRGNRLDSETCSQSIVWKIEANRCSRKVSGFVFDRCKGRKKNGNTRIIEKFLEIDTGDISRAGKNIVAQVRFDIYRRTRAVKRVNIYI